MAFWNKSESKKELKALRSNASDEAVLIFASHTHNLAISVKACRD